MVSRTDSFSLSERGKDRERAREKARERERNGWETTLYIDSKQNNSEESHDRLRPEVIWQ